MSTDYADKPLEKPLKLVLKVGGSEVTELSGSGHDSSYYDDRSDHERERHKEKKKKKKKKSEKEKHLDDEERRKRKVSEGGRKPWGAGGARASWPPEASVLFLVGCRVRRAEVGCFGFGSLRIFSCLAPGGRVFEGWWPGVRRGSGRGLFSLSFP